MTTIKTLNVKFLFALQIISISLWINTSINGKVDVFNNIYKLWIIDYMGALSGTYILWRISVFLASKKGMFSRMLNYAGVYSIVILSFHSIEFLFPQWFKLLFFLPEKL